MCAMRDNFEERMKLATIISEQNKYKPQMTFSEIRENAIMRNSDDLMTTDEVNIFVNEARKK